MENVLEKGKGQINVRKKLVRSVLETRFQENTLNPDRENDVNIRIIASKYII